MIRDNLEPVPSYEPRVIEQDGTTVLAIEVSGGARCTPTARDSARRSTSASARTRCPHATTRLPPDSGRVPPAQRSEPHAPVTRVPPAPACCSARALRRATIEIQRRVGYAACQPVLVLSFKYVPPPTPVQYDRLVREVSKDSQQLKPDQHVVSRVLLDQFAEPVGAKGERLVSRLNRAYMKAKPTKRCPRAAGGSGVVLFAGGHREF